ncbi:class I SAM-dependent methyltransferase [Alkalihalobacterium chitinilyticum]|uniref:Class I SAM-dependent methyltransferase n=1 Tax=Alkalihalobacterium chitinilyticum TaxID=2980103 RepID=A0ABT5VH36_9BACI|nr:class I SAM-dependent methyltransferase [Alkalihalobacterium chitinilyticum]MDE5414647.1 class I SAM-dependent methyltransferase [Alkalihalobacterium chitinilyticum]
MNINIDYIRQEEAKYHNEFYKENKLFEKGSWLFKPVPNVLRYLNAISKKQNMRILDLGCGVGRHSIPLAEKVRQTNGVVDCVDYLETAVEKLREYSTHFNVQANIHPVLSLIEEFPIEEQAYHYIVAVSSLEHVESVDQFTDVLHRMIRGTRAGGVHYLVINSGVEEIDGVTGNQLDPLFEVNLPTEKMMSLLQEVYRGWSELEVVVKPLEYTINRGEKVVQLKTNAITFVIQKPVD